MTKLGNQEVGQLISSENLDPAIMADQAAAEAGVDNNVLMGPLATQQGIDKNIVDRTDLIKTSGDQTINGMKSFNANTYFPAGINANGLLWGHQNATPINAGNIGQLQYYDWARPGGSNINSMTSARIENGLALTNGHFEYWLHVFCFYTVGPASGQVLIQSGPNGFGPDWKNVDYPSHTGRIVIAAADSSNAVTHGMFQTGRGVIDVTGTVYLDFVIWNYTTNHMNFGARLWARRVG